MTTRDNIRFAADGISLADIGNAAKWHRQFMIDALAAKGMSHADAEAFACFAIAEDAILNGGITDSSPEDLVTDAQWDRLTLIEPTR